ncbi:hypothetical protein EBR66_06575, partial [bacterium]|nr:hypothetical protein [bacterium]
MGSRRKGIGSGGSAGSNAKTQKVPKNVMRGGDAATDMFVQLYTVPIPTNLGVSPSLWLDAMDVMNTGVGNVYPIDKGILPVWRDKSGNGNDFSMFAGVMTNVTLDAVVQQPMVQIQGGNQYGFAPVSPPINTPVMCTYVVFKGDLDYTDPTLNNNQGGYWWGLSQTNISFSGYTKGAQSFAFTNPPTGTLDINLGYGNIYFTRGNSYYGTVSGGMTPSGVDGNWCYNRLIEIICDGTNQTVTMYQWENTQSKIPKPGKLVTMTAPMADSFNIDYMKLGSVWQAAGIRVGELLMFNTLLTSAQQDMMRAYLFWKWGMAPLLPTTNPLYPTTALSASYTAAKTIIANTMQAKMDALRYSIIFKQSVRPNVATYFQGMNATTWLDAMDPNADYDGASIPNGSYITRWIDKSGSGNHATIGGITGGGALYAKSFLNGKPAIRTLRSVASAIVGPINLSGQGRDGASMTLFAVTSMTADSAGWYATQYGNMAAFYTGSKPTDASPTVNIGLSGYTTPSYKIDLGYGDPNLRNSNWWVPYYSGLSLTGSVQNTDKFNSDGTGPGPMLWGFSFDSPNKNFVARSFSGTSSVTTTQNTSPNGSTLSIANYAFGMTVQTAAAAGQQQMGSVNLSELLIFPYVLSDTQRQIVEAYISWKWGLQNRLPTTHPYAPSTTLTTTLASMDTAITKIATDGLNTAKDMLVNSPSAKALIKMRALGIPSIPNGKTPILWLDAMDPLNNGISVSDKATIPNWKDKSGFDNDCTINATYWSTGMLGSRPAVAGGGEGRLANPLTGNALTIFIVGHLIPADYILMFVKPDGNWDAGITPGTGLYRSGLSLTPSSNAFAPTPAVGLHVAWFNGTNAYYTCYQGCGQIPYMVGSSTGTFSATNYRLRGGFYSEIVVFNSILMQNERQAMEGYLAYKWGLLSLLPPSHPYTAGGSAEKAYTSQYTTLTNTIIQQASAAGTISGAQSSQAQATLLANASQAQILASQAQGNALAIQAAAASAASAAQAGQGSANAAASAASAAATQVGQITNAATLAGQVLQNTQLQTASTSVMGASAAAAAAA